MLDIFWSPTTSSAPGASRDGNHTGNNKVSPVVGDADVDKGNGGEHGDSVGEEDETLTEGFWSMSLPTILER